MHGEKKNMIEWCCPKQAHPKQRCLTKSKGCMNFPARKLVSLCSGVGDARQIRDRYRYLASVVYNLLELFSLQPECCSQAVVPVYHFLNA